MMVVQEGKTSMRMIRKRGDVGETRKETERRIMTVTIERKIIAIVGIVLAIIETAREILLAIVTTRNPRRIEEIALALFQSREITIAETETTTDEPEMWTMTDETETKITREETNPKTTNAEKKTEENTQTLGKEIGMRILTNLRVGGKEMAEMEKVTGLRVDKMRADALIDALAEIVLV
jgi:hypothetical protein